ncbi:amidohydrolase [Nakamurella antarctica]|uniref:Amidohydrolase n=2 Tax=Nakamurella antarctica TaxID=1902245 RepID=A0A3G8ZQN8_9ACTN|nr:amidohydrolase [Nakamurella antarctica]
MTPEARAIDVHQHLWPLELVEVLRSRSSFPYVRDWTLHLAGEAPFQVDPIDHDIAARMALDSSCDKVLLSLSSPLGIEQLSPDDAEPLLQAWHSGAAALPEPFGAWAAIGEVDPDTQALRAHLAAGFVGLQISATQLASPAAVERLAPVLRICELANKPVIVHPGPVPARPHTSEQFPDWWPAVVDYSAQMQAAWWAWQIDGRNMLPNIRICFLAGAGLAPLHHERFTMRGGTPLVIDPNTFVETSSYGRLGLDSLIRVLGIDTIVFGSDRPNAEPTDPQLGPAATYAVRISNPRRFLEGGQP